MPRSPCHHPVITLIRTNMLRFHGTWRYHVTLHGNKTAMVVHLTVFGANTKWLFNITLCEHYWVGPRFVLKSPWILHRFHKILKTFLPLRFPSMLNWLHHTISAHFPDALLFPLVTLILLNSYWIMLMTWKATEKHKNHCHVYETKLRRILLCDVVYYHAGSSS